MKEQLGRVMVPVLLGDSAQAKGIAHRLYRRFGVISHIYCAHPSLFTYLLSCARVVRTPDYLQGELLLEDLCTFAREYPDLLFCLIPCSDQYRAFCLAHARELEPYYVILQPEQLQKDALPYLSKEELPV